MVVHLAFVIDNLILQEIVKVTKDNSIEWEKNL
jgi:hypothetical protein